ncbi:hypothetical protein SAMN05216522_10214 [Rosenbergiella nectarea]|uniref:Uncharacterized protein n=1 Tax=Rosenbergiella nectarea TaxID=988801 RepID=A0A1H9EPA3_9GAMM|nr:hypothetical protein [Rosenbergiella nectarea]SEQ27586.1 hypothetical protein SAMN05216522_10214 [Rosenbergiella nectarea]
MGLKPAEEPEIDELTALILSAYSVISRGRQYAGMAASPLPLSLSDIDTYLRSRPIQVNREMFEQAIFALDDVYREEVMKGDGEPEEDEE